MVSRILVDETTTLYDICIKNYINNCNEGNNEKAEYNIEVFKFLLERRQLKTNFAELVVKIVDYARYNPEFACELLDAMERHKGKINFNQDVFISHKPQESGERTDTNDNDVREPSVSSSNSQKLV